MKAEAQDMHTMSLNACVPHVCQVQLSKTNSTNLINHCTDINKTCNDKHQWFQQGAPYCKSWSQL